MKNEVIMHIGDNHFPYQHRDMIPFLTDLKKLYAPTRVIHLGDESDGHGYSYHESDPDLPSSGDEYKKAKAYMQGLAELFPTLEIMESNHGSLMYRKQKSSKMPRAFLKSYNQLWEVPDTWTWHFNLEIEICTGQKVLYQHQISAAAINAAKERGTCFVQGHFHGKASLIFYGDEYLPNWALQNPCLIDSKLLAYAYGKNNKDKPKIGASFIMNGIPLIFLMPMDKQGRYKGLIR